jgi:hypothetical protein
MNITLVQGEGEEKTWERFSDTSQTRRCWQRYGAAVENDSKANLAIDMEEFLPISVS